MRICDGALQGSRTVTPLGLPSLYLLRRRTQVMAIAQKESIPTSNVATTPRKRRSKLMRDQMNNVAHKASSTQSTELKLGPLLQQHCIRIPVGDREIVIETGSIGKQANGAVTITDGETILYTTVCSDKQASEPKDFIPLFVHYMERFSAAGRTSGAFHKREGKPREEEIIVSRLIDRPLRPMIAKGYNNEIQILSWVLSYDGMHSPEPLAITAAGAALAISDIPFLKAVAGVRIGLLNGSFVVNPTNQELIKSKLDMIVAGTSDGILMIEGYCDFLTEEQLLKAVEVGQNAVAVICKKIEDFAQTVGRAKNHAAIHLPPPEIEQDIEELVGEKLRDAFRIQSKQARAEAVAVLEETVCMKLTEEGVSRAKLLDKNKEEVVDDTWDENETVLEDIDQGEVHLRPQKPISMKLFDIADVRMAFKIVSSRTMRRMIVQEKKRSDGRGISDVRSIESSCSLLPRAHGSALFTRGETQALVVATLGGDNMVQRLDSITDTDAKKRFYVQYVFPHSCVGETGRLSAPTRREIGHGILIERALEPALPKDADFPYAIRIESTITESNGSSSMASVCGASLALWDAGVPLKCSIAGVAMGLISDPKEYGGSGGAIVLSDILGSEDAFGDMDLKVAGSEDGITAFQMDIKAECISLSVLKRALAKAKTCRKHILKAMSKSNPAPSSKLSKHVGLIEQMKIDPEKVHLVIGTGGKIIKSIIDDSGVDSIDVNSDGSIRMMGKTPEMLLNAKQKITNLTVEPVVGAVYRGCVVKSSASFGCFVEIRPGKEALCHISELSSEKRLTKVEEFVDIGDRLDVKVIEVNGRGQIRVSHKALLQDN